MPDSSSLLGIKLRSYVRTLLDVDLVGSANSARSDSERQSSAIGSSVAGHVHDGRGVVVTEGRRGLGPALWWGSVAGAESLDVIVDVDDQNTGGHLSRRAGLLCQLPGAQSITVWNADGPDLVRAEPVDAPAVPVLPASHWAFASSISEAGARPVDDHGRLVAEVAGLEVARVVEGEDGPRIEVGVGEADRELNSYIHGNQTDDANLRRSVVAVARDRTQPGGHHPLGRLTRQRWLRSKLLDNPGLLGFGELSPITPLWPSETVLRTEPAAAYSADGDAVVVSSVGVDPDLVPEAVDLRHRDHPSSRLIIVTPKRDRALAVDRFASLVDNLTVASIDEPWLATPN